MTWIYCTIWACNPSNITLDQGVDWSPDSCVKMAYNGIDMHTEIHWFNSLSANSKGVHYLEIVQWSLDKQLMQQEKNLACTGIVDASFHTTGSSKCTILFLSCRTICRTNFIEEETKLCNHQSANVARVAQGGKQLPASTLNLSFSFLAIYHYHVI
jgi:hypothetical protein